jgi:EamA domain-containing membrane protein RarD
VYDEAVSAAKLVGFGAIWVCLVLVIVDLFTTQRRTAPALT